MVLFDLWPLPGPVIAYLTNNDLSVLLSKRLQGKLL